MGHYRLDYARRNIEQLKKMRNIAQSIKMLSTPPLALQERLLAQCRAQDDGGIRLRQREEPPEQRIHRPISKQDRITIALDLVLRRLQRKRVGVHVTPICMLQMCGAIDEEGRKIGGAFADSSAETNRTAGGPQVLPAAT
jgi:hypothetical protein